MQLFVAAAALMLAASGFGLQVRPINNNNPTPHPCAKRHSVPIGMPSDNRNPRMVPSLEACRKRCFRLNKQEDNMVCTLYKMRVWPNRKGKHECYLMKNVKDVLNRDGWVWSSVKCSKEDNDEGRHHSVPETPAVAPDAKGPGPKCATPAAVTNGDWHCPAATAINDTCYLDCNPGYVPKNQFSTTCNSESAEVAEWSTDPTTMACVKGAALITGNNELYAKTVEIFGSNNDKKLTDMPEVRHGHTLDYLNGHVYLCGGGDSAATKQSCLKGTYDPVNKDITWAAHSTMDSERYGHSSEVVRARLSLIGGGYDNTRSTVESLSGTAWSQVGTNLAHATTKGCSVKVSGDDVIVISGGFPTVTAKRYNLANPSLPSTSLTAPPTEAKLRFSCALINHGTNGSIILAGGSDHEVFDTTYLYDIALDSWTNIHKLTTARSEASTRLIVIDGKAHMFGGYNDHHDVEQHKLNSVEAYDVASNTWTVVGQMLEPRWRYGITLVPSEWFD